MDENNINILEENIDESKIYKKINNELCGNIIERRANYASVRFTPTQAMITDDNMLIHYGFIFSSASFCAISAVNRPNAIIIYSEVKFLSPLELGNEVIFKAKVLQSDLKKREVLVEGFLFNIKIFDAIFHIVVFEQNIFSIDFNSIE